MTLTAHRKAPTSALDTVSHELSACGLILQRSWPRDETHLLLEAVGREGTVAGQWFASPNRAAKVASATPGATRLSSVVLQPRGADRRLSSLAMSLRSRGAVLVAHRPERRAVLRQVTDTDGEARPVYIKVVRRDRFAAVAGTAAAAAALPLRTPRVLAVDRARGSVTTAALPGVPLYDLLSGDRAVEACRATGAGLARLHRLPPPGGLALHGPAEDATVVARWQHLADSYGVGRAFPDRVPAGSGSPTGGPVTYQRALIHRDFHDKQVLVDVQGDVGVLDFDLMAVGDPMLDLANLLVHLDLRARQGLVTDAAALRAAVLDGYGPTTEQLARVPAHEATTWARLSAVYAFRSASRAT